MRGNLTQGKERSSSQTSPRQRRARCGARAPTCRARGRPWGARHPAATAPPGLRGSSGPGSEEQRNKGRAGGWPSLQGAVPRAGWMWWGLEVGRQPSSQWPNEVPWLWWGGLCVEVVQAHP